MQIEATNFTEQDAQAVGAVRGGDAERYRELVERHERRVYAVAWSRLGDATLAEEATQEAFIRAYRRLWLLGDGAKFAGWIASITRHVAINFGLRHRRELNKRERWALEQAPVHETPHTTEADTPCTPETLRQTLAELPAAHRECLVLFYLEGKSGAEAAATLGITESALRVRLHRARAALRERLEDRLGDSLRKLGPAKTLVPAIMAGVFASTSVKAATASGTVGIGLGAKLLASASKILPVTTLMPLLQVIASAPGLLLSMWIWRLDRRNFRDATGFRIRLHRDYYRSFLWGFPLLMVLVALPIHFAGSVGGMNAEFVWGFTFLVVITSFAARTLAIHRNPFQVGMLLYCVIITVGIGMLAIGWLPPSGSSLPMITGTLLFAIVLKHRPTRLDYSLFLRATQGMLEPSVTSEKPVKVSPQTRADLLAFARFLGSRWLTSNYRWEKEGLALRLPPVKTRFMANMTTALVPMSRACSRVLLRWDGTVAARCGEADASDLAAMKQPSAFKLGETEHSVETAVEEAWSAFRMGSSTTAERLLGELPEAEVFVVPTARALSTRWMRIILGVFVLLMGVLMVKDWQRNRLSMVSGRYLKPVAFTESEIRTALARFGEETPVGSNALREASAAFWLSEVLPEESLFTSNAWQTLRERGLTYHFDVHRPATERVDGLLGAPNLLRAIANGWISETNLELTPQAFRHAVVESPAATRDRWLRLRAVKMKNRDHTQADYSVLNVEEIARRIQCLRRFNCLNAVDGNATVEELIKHQVLSQQLPPDRRQLPFPELVHGTFLTFGSNPIEDTYLALVILDAFDALSRIDREACIRGILRFHHGQGLFGSVRQGDGFAIFGNTRDTFRAFESLRMLGALNRVKDLDRWQFRPLFVSKLPITPVEARELTWAEIEAWVCQQRLARILAEHIANPAAPIRSLLEP